MSDLKEILEFHASSKIVCIFKFCDLVKRYPEFKL